MIIKELKEKIGTDRFIKISIILGFILLTVICYLKKIKINIEWDMIATILGFWGVILTIKETEKSRIKQNQYDYKKEKITDEQIEFKHVIKEKVDLLDFSQEAIHLFNIDTNNYRNMFFEVNTYRGKVVTIKNDIKWYYEKGVILENSEIEKFFELLDEYIDYYDERLEKYSNVILKYGRIKLLEESTHILSREEIARLNPENKTVKVLLENVIEEQYNIFLDIVKFRGENISNLYKQAHLVIEERDNLMKKQLDTEK